MLWVEEDYVNVATVTDFLHKMNGYTYTTYEIKPYM
jgi:hypothetical protein